MKWLLPEYIEDILPAQAMRVEQLRRKILDLFFSRKYELVMPPLLEYMDSLLTGTGHALASARSVASAFLTAGSLGSFFSACLSTSGPP